MLRGAIIGVGNIALRGHLPAYVLNETLKEEVTITAAADLSPLNLEKAREVLPSVRTYTSSDELLDREELDFVDICSPPNTRLEIIEKALSRGCHIVSEKPLATNLTEARIIAEKIRGKGVVFAPCHQYRYSAIWRSVKEILEGGDLGKLFLAQFNVFRVKADSGTPEWQSDWRVDPKISGGGILVDTGSHYLYLLAHFFGKPKQITARTATLRHHEYPVEDTALIIAEYDHLVAQINLTWAADRRQNRNLIIGEKGNLVTTGDRILLNLNGLQKELPGEDISDKSTYIQWYAALLKDFFQRVKNSNHSYSLLDEAVDVLYWTQCCYESALKGVTVPVQ